jgi:hypothetical protein
MRGALRAGMTTAVRPQAERNIRKQSGELGRSLKVRTRLEERRRDGEPLHEALLRADGRIRHAAPLDRAEERKSARRSAASSTGSVHHPGGRANAFMRNALDTQARAGVVAAAGYMKQRLAEKNGIDTAGIVLEGDE